MKMNGRIEIAPGLRKLYKIICRKAFKVLARTIIQSLFVFDF